MGHLMEGDVEKKIKKKKIRQIEIIENKGGLNLNKSGAKKVSYKRITAGKRCCFENGIIN